MVVKIKCPKCKIDGSLSMVESNYQGPYRCWTCRELFIIKTEINELESCEPFSREEFDRQKEMEALKAKFKQH
jgi:hypothetical protein